MEKMVDDVFVDTNILVYTLIKESPFHLQAIRKLEQLMKNKANLWVCRQVIRELLVILSRPGNFEIDLPLDIVHSLLTVTMKSFVVADEDYRITEQLLETVLQYQVKGKSVHDANIVATCQVYRIPYILTHNVSDFKRYADILTILPLLETT